MGFFNRKKQDEKKPEEAKPEAKVADSKKEVKPNEKSEIKPKKTTETKPGEIKGKSNQAHLVLVKPLVTEKATDLGALNKYVFAVNPKMNKVEVKKAIRSIYKVDPIQINILNFSGRKVKFGRVQGTTKRWKKAIVTLKPGDKIEIYEGV